MRVSWHSSRRLSRRVALLVSAVLLSSLGLRAADIVIPDPPKPPAPEEVLASNKLAGADEAALLRYVTEHREFIETWLPRVILAENERLASEYAASNDPYRRDGPKKASPTPGHQELADKLTQRRLKDPVRVVDAALRELGRIGKPASIPALVKIAKREKSHWARWKALAGIQEIMLREPPPDEAATSAMRKDLPLIAPLLRDLPEEQAGKWAAALWSDSASQSLVTRMWLARHAAVSMRKEAAAVFLDGLSSTDAAHRTLAAMLLRECLGGSLRHGETGEAMVAKLLLNGANPTRNLWEVFPKPLEQPLLFVHGFTNGRTDLIWIDRSGNKLDRRGDDEVFPGVRHVLPNGLFYSRRGDSHPYDIALTDANGGVFTRFARIDDTVAPATHGGLWCILTSDRIATEFAAGGSVLWQCPTERSLVREIAPYSAGRTLFLGFGVLECRNRRGDILWKADIKKLEDPRSIVAFGEGCFLVSCKTSIGTLTQEGVYEPLLKDLKSASWIRYHPGAEWLVHDGANYQIHVFDPVTKQATGSINLELRPSTNSKFVGWDRKLPE